MMRRSASEPPDMMLMISPVRASVPDWWRDYPQPGEADMVRIRRWAHGSSPTALANERAPVQMMRELDRAVPVAKRRQPPQKKPRKLSPLVTPQMGVTNSRRL